MNVVKEYHAPHENVLFNYRDKDGTGYTYCPCCKKFVEMDLHYKSFLVRIENHTTTDTVTYTSNFNNSISNFAPSPISKAKQVKEIRDIVVSTPIGRYSIDFQYGVCKECQSKFDKEDYRVVTLDRSYSSPDYTPLNHVYVVNDTSKKGKKLLTVISIFTKHSCWNKKMQYEKVAFKIIFNLETGMTYATPMYYLKNKKHVYEHQRNYLNITYYIDSNFPSATQIAKIIREPLIEAKKEFCPYLQEPREKATIAELTLFNRMPSVKPLYLRNNIDATKSKGQIYREIRSIKANTADFYGEALKLLKVKPNKTLRRYLLSGGSYTSLKVMVKAFNQTDSISKFNDYDFSKEHLEFLKAMIEAYGETNAVNKILFKDNRSNNFLFGVQPATLTGRKSLSYDFKDSVSMWNKIKQYGEEYAFPKKSTMKEIHDDLTMQEKKLRKKNKVLKYREHEIKRFQKETDRFILRFAKETHELIEVGSKMGICVGSYDDKAYTRECDILLVIDKTNNYYVGCIERRKEALEQIKACGNKVPEGELYDFIKEWLEEIKIENPGYDWQRAVRYREENKTQYIHTGQKGAYFANVEVPTQEEYDNSRKKTYSTTNWNVQVNYV